MTRKLPAGTCISHAIRSVRNNIAYAFRISWPWYLVITLVGLGANYITGGDVETPRPEFLPLYLIVLLVNLLGFASIAVNWHRYILLDEVPRSSELFRLDGKVWRYFGNVLLIMLAMMAAGVVLVVPAAILTAMSESMAALIIGFLIYLPLAAILFYRLAVKLPAIALGRRDFTMRDAWGATRENNGSIFLVALFQFLIGAAILIVLGLLGLGLVAVDEMLAVAVTTIIQLAVSWVLAIFGITILTSLYGFFVEGRDF